MVWIKTIGEDEAEGLLKEIYDRNKHPETGRVSDLHKASSLDPVVLDSIRNMFRTLLFSQSGLNRIQREMIAVVVSIANGCRY